MNKTYQTKYFGTFIDRMADRYIAQPLVELTGTIKVHELNGIKAAFMYESLPDDKGYVRYDMPAFASKYENEYVAVLGRKVTKIVGDKQYNKLIVVQLKSLRPTKAYLEKSNETKGVE